jgi:glycosyltransferase involved in cell wall biosynthesis
LVSSRTVSFAERLLRAAAVPLLYAPIRAGESSVQPAAAGVSSGLPPQRISVVTPSLNQGEFLERTLRSVLDQRHPALEYVVQDGGSTDASPAILQRWGDRLAGWDSRPDAGQSAAINAGFRRTTGEIMLYLNSDDVLFPGALPFVSDYFAAHPEVDVVYSHALLIDRDDRQVAAMTVPRHSDRALRWYNFVPQPTCAWRRRVWEVAGSGLDESLHYSMDWDLWNRFLDVGARFARLPTFLAGFRVHPAQKTQQKWMVGRDEGNLVRRRHTGRDVSFAEFALRCSPHALRRIALTCACRLGARRIELPCRVEPCGCES